MKYILIAAARLAALIGIGTGIFSATASIGLAVAAICAVWLIMPEQKV